MHTRSARAASLARTKSRADSCCWVVQARPRPTTTNYGSHSRRSSLKPFLDRVEELVALSDDFDLFAVPPVAVSMGDTVNAGDSFMAGLISGLLGSAAASQQLAGAGSHRVQPALHRAVLTSAITVGRTGAYAHPRRGARPERVDPVAARLTPSPSRHPVRS
jgi:hypothetical protein